MSGSRLVQVFRSVARDGMYLIVDRARGLADVPEALLQRFGHSHLCIWQATRFVRKINPYSATIEAATEG